jgi:thioredoxin reductase/Pyruvate/2-oxoacid:ferredoxin oxidoreductase delta subunit
MIPYLIVTLVILVIFVWPAWRQFRREEAEAREMLSAALAAGMHEPTTIRPWINPERCMGSGACVSACPERNVLKVIDGKAVVVEGCHCVGHGACVTACPVRAIELRFGSEKRGIDIPAVATDFQTNVPGLYVAGELGGMGLIANAVRQGTQAMGFAAKGLPAIKADALAVIIVGAGPAGIGASLTAKQAGLNHVVLEQDALGGSLLHFPRKKVVMSHGLTLPGRPKVPRATLSKEELVELLGNVVREEDLPVAEHEAVEAITRGADGFFEVKTTKRTLRAPRVILAVGRRGTPRRLGVPGEELSKVAYRLVDPELIHHSHVLVVGGGDSALEAACALAEQPGNRVTLSYRGAALARAKAGNKERLDAAVAAGTVNLLLGTEVATIAPDRVALKGGPEPIELPNDFVYVFAGGVLPTDFLRASGIEIERHFGGRVEKV